MERRSSLTVQLQRNEKLIKLLIVGVLGAVILCYSLQIIMFLIPIIYPGYNTIKILQVWNLNQVITAHHHTISVQTDSVKLRKRWLSYWLLYSSIAITEQLPLLLSWLVPLYSLARTVFLLWCLAPFQYNGAEIVYNVVIKPLLANNFRHLKS